jgi:hypothetical protein
MICKNALWFVSLRANFSDSKAVDNLKKCSKKLRKTVDIPLILWDTAVTHGNTNYTNMRTKALICAAALLAAGAATSMAQNVYSLNVVGYVQLSLTNGFNMVANQMDLDGTGMNNTIQSVLGTNVPSGTKVFAFNPATQTYYSTATLIGTLWTAGAAVAPGLQPGSGVWVQIGGANGTPTPLTVTLVGNVRQGNNAFSIVGGSPKKFQIMSLVPPISTAIETGTFSTGQPAGYPTAIGDSVYLWNAVAKSYGSTRTKISASIWSGGEPVPAIGQGFWLASVSNKTWNQNFTVP